MHFNMAKMSSSYSTVFGYHCRNIAKFNQTINYTRIQS